MENIGESFRKLRKERGFTLKTMSEGIVSFSYLSKFEKGKSQITLINFIPLAQRLNVTIDEILYFSNIEMTNYVNFFKKISFAYSNNDITTLKQYLEIQENLYKKTNIDYHKYNSIMIAVIINNLDKSFSISESESKLLVDYVVKCSFWTTYEVSLFGNVLPLFSEELLTILLEEVKKRIVNYKVMNRNYRDLIGILQNACIIFLRNKKVEQAISLSDFLETAIEKNHYFGKIRQLYIKGIIDIALGNNDKGLDKARKAIDVINLMDEKYAKNHELELKHFQSKSMYGQ